MVVLRAELSSYHNFIIAILQYEDHVVLLEAPKKKRFFKVKKVTVYFVDETISPKGAFYRCSSLSYHF